MDTFKWASAAALTKTFEFVEERPEERPQPLLHASANGARETTRKKWESLKPLIEQLYILENRPFSYLASILRQEHGFKPT